MEKKRRIELQVFKITSVLMGILAINFFLENSGAIYVGKQVQPPREYLLASGTDKNRVFYTEYLDPISGVSENVRDVRPWWLEEKDRSPDGNVSLHKVGTVVRIEFENNPTRRIEIPIEQDEEINSHSFSPDSSKVAVITSFQMANTNSQDIVDIQQLHLVDLVTGVIHSQELRHPANSSSLTADTDTSRALFISRKTAKSVELYACDEQMCTTRELPPQSLDCSQLEINESGLFISCVSLDPAKKGYAVYRNNGAGWVQVTFDPRYVGPFALSRDGQYLGYAALTQEGSMAIVGLNLQTGDSRQAIAINLYWPPTLSWTSEAPHS